MELLAKLSSLNADALEPANAVGSTEVRPRSDKSRMLTCSPSKARDWISSILVSP